MKKLIIILVVFSILALTFYLYKNYQYNKIYNNLAFAYGNGRLEATEINIASKLAGKIDDIYVKEGDFVQANQKLAHIETNTLNASKMQALAIVKVKEAELAAAQATVLQKISNLNNAENRYKRAKSLVVKNATSLQTYENDLAIYESAKAELAVAQANVKQAHAAIEAAIADVNRIDVDIKDSTIVAPLKGRIQYRIAEPGEVVSSGGRLLNLVDLTDVYMTFFLPEGTAGKVRLGAPARILLDAIPNYPIPATISYVASTAQFTPKTVETKVEREKLMFRIKARIAPELLSRYIQYVKTGLPGVAWVKINPDVPWPDFLKVKTVVNNKAQVK
jgi:HlyD family secretion protein